MIDEREGKDKEKDKERQADPDDRRDRDRGKPRAAGEEIESSARLPERQSNADQSSRSHPDTGKDGWSRTSQKGSHRQFKHPVKRGKVTVPVSSRMNCRSAPRGAFSDKPNSRISHEH